LSRARRVWHPGCAEHTDLTLDREESDHLRRVLRCREGDPVGVFDGRGGEWHAEVVAVGKEGVRLLRGDPVPGEVESPLRLSLFQALCRHERMEWLVQKATEVGVAAIHPVRTARSEAAAPTPGRLERWRRIARESCKQSGRRRIPGVEPRDGLPPAGDAPGPAILLDAGPGAAPLATVLPAETSRPAALWLAVGPEGGFDADERARLVDAGWIAASLGPRTLRTETAGVIAASIVLHRLGDLGAAVGPAPPV
jgi:16S rRNA (uracil1498-N3)-methyltransferase